MRTYFAAPAALLLILMMGYTESTQAADARAAFLNTTREYAEALKSGDFARIQSFYAPDIAVYAPGLRLKGLEAVKKLQASDTKDHSRDVFELSSEDVQVSATGDIAYTTGTYRLSHSDGRATDSGRFVAIWRVQEAGNWALAEDVLLPDQVSNPAP
jgi:ketosteroid isomerase-like protein